MKSSPDCSSFPGQLARIEKNPQTFYNFRPKRHTIDAYCCLKDTQNLITTVQRVTLTHLKAPLVHTRWPSMVVSVLVLVGVTLLMILMARRRGTSVTLGRSGGLHVWQVVFRDSWFGRALGNSLIFTITTVGWREANGEKKTNVKENHFHFWPYCSFMYLFSYSFWEAHLGSCGLACVSWRCLTVILSAVSDLLTLQKNEERAREERLQNELSARASLVFYI